MSDFIIGKIMELAEKMAKVEEMYFRLSEGHKEQAESIKDLGGLMLDIKQTIGKLEGRTEKGDTHVKLESNMNVENKDGDINASQTNN